MGVRCWPARGSKMLAGCVGHVMLVGAASLIPVAALVSVQSVSAVVVSVFALVCWHREFAVAGCILSPRACAWEARAAAQFVMVCFAFVACPRFPTDWLGLRPSPPLTGTAEAAQGSSENRRPVSLRAFFHMMVAVA